MMKRFLVISLLLAGFANAGAQNLLEDFLFGPFGHSGKATPGEEEKKVSFAYDLDFLYRFDNREFAASSDAVTPSMTTHGVVFTPEAGVKVRPDRIQTHKVMAGIMATHDMGTSSSLIPGENKYDLLAFYNYTTGLGRITGFSATAGIFPRNRITGEYSEAFFSDSLKYYDPLVEGMLLQFNSPSFRAELGLDWMGQKGEERKERFQIYSSGKWAPLSWLSAGWAASMYHYAGSVQAPGVVDNHMVNPYVKFSCDGALPLFAASLKAGLLATYQWDRKFDGSVRAPFGGEFVLDLWYAGFTLRNTTYVGKDLLYYYNDRDAAGNKYGNLLYRGSPFYTGFYDLAEIGWKPLSAGCVDLSVNLRFHFSGSGYMGCQQVCSLLFNLEKAGRTGAVRTAVKKKKVRAEAPGQRAL